MRAVGLRRAAFSLLPAVVGTLLCASAWMHAQEPAAQQPKPAFETRAELVLVDVNVVDREAKPLPTLTASDFTLEVNGQPRPIASVQFISTAPTNTTPAAPREAAASSNETATTGRLLLFVVDEGSIRVGSARGILRTARGNRSGARGEGASVSDTDEMPADFHAATAQFQSRLIREALSAAGGNLPRAAEALKLSRHALRHQMIKLGIEQD